MLFALVFLYPILAGGSMEKIWLGYLATLLLSAPIPSRRFVNYAHQMPAGQRHEPTTFPKASRCVFYYSRTAFPRASRCVFYYSRTVFSRASRCVFYYSRFAAGGFLAASLVMEPSCSGLMVVSPPGPADARIGMIGTASQQPA